MQNKWLILTIGVAVLLAVAALLMYLSPKETAPKPVVTNFEECKAAGYPIMESYPEQCRTPEGALFVRVIENIDITPTPPVKPPISDKCYVGGCSSQVCSDREGIITTCEYREEYACYKSAKCERQNDGKCGWTPSPALNACLNSKANL